MSRTTSGSFRGMPALAVACAICAVLGGSPAVGAAAAAGPQSMGSLVSDARSELERMNEFAALEGNSRQLLKEGQFAEARRVAMRALALNVSNRRAKLLLADIDTAEKAAAPAPPGRAPGDAAIAAPARARESAPAVVRPAPPVPPPPARPARPLPSAADTDAQALRDVVRAYLAGDYPAAIAAASAAGETAPARVWLYAACSEAALGLLDARDAEERLGRARELYARAAASGASFAADRRVISPRVWDAVSKP